MRNRTLSFAVVCAAALAAIHAGVFAPAGEKAPAEPAVQPAIACPAGCLVYGANAITLSLENLTEQEQSAAAELKLPDGWACEPPAAPFALKAGKGQRAVLQFTLKIPPATPLGDYEIAVSTPANKAAVSLTLALSTPLGDFSRIRLAEVHSSAPSMAVPVKNPLTRPVSARVSIAADDWSFFPAFVPVELLPGEEKVLRFLADGRLPAAGSLPLTVTVATAGKTAEALKLRRMIDVSRQRAIGGIIGKPDVSLARFDGRNLTYNLSRTTVVSVRIYDARGGLVRTLDSGWQPAGAHRYEWVPGREFDDRGERILYRAEVRAGLDLAFDRQIAAPPDTIFAAKAVAVDAASAVCVIEGARVMKFGARGYIGSDLPGWRSADIHSIRPLAQGKYVGLKGNQLLLLDHAGAVLKTLPPLSHDASGPRPAILSNPSDVAVSHDGLVYVADTGNHRVLRFTAGLETAPFASGGNALGKAAAAGGAKPADGAGNGEFTSPRRLAAGPQLCVLDATGRVQKFDANGKFAASIDLQCKDAACIAAGADGSIFYARAGSRQVQKAEASATPARPVPQFGAQGSASLECTEIVSMAVCPKGKLYVCSQGPAAVHVLDSISGKVQGTLGRKWSPAAPATMIAAAPGGLDADSQGSVTVADLAAQQVMRISPAGELQWVSPDPRMPVRIYRPLDVALQPAGVYVLDETATGKTLVMLDHDGQPRFDFGGTYVLQRDDLAKASTVEVDAGGNIWVGASNRGVHLNSAGRLLIRNVPQPNTKAAAGGILYSAWEDDLDRGIAIRDAREVRNRDIARKGALGTADGRFSGCMPGGIAATAGGPGKPDLVYYADFLNHRIVVLRAEWCCIMQAAP